jgi:hypothetical protein
MPYDYTLPDGRTIRGIPDSVTNEQLRTRLIKKFPEFFPDEIKAQQGFVPSFKRELGGVLSRLPWQTLGGLEALASKVGIGHAPGREIPKPEDQPIVPPASLGQVIKGEAPVGQYLGETLGGVVGYGAIPVAATTAATMGGLPALAAAGIGGATMFPGILHDLRQRILEKAPEMDPEEVTNKAAGPAALEAVMYSIPVGRGTSRLLGRDLPKTMEQATAEQLAKMGGEGRIKAALKGAAIEAPAAGAVGAANEAISQGTVAGATGAPFDLAQIGESAAQMGIAGTLFGAYGGARSRGAAQGETARRGQLEEEGRAKIATDKKAREDALAKQAEGLGNLQKATIDLQQARVGQREQMEENLAQTQGTAAPILREVREGERAVDQELAGGQGVEDQVRAQTAAARAKTLAEKEEAAKYVPTPGGMIDETYVANLGLNPNSGWAKKLFNPNKKEGKGKEYDFNGEQIKGTLREIIAKSKKPEQVAEAQKALARYEEYEVVKAKGATGAKNVSGTNQSGVGSAGEKPAGTGGAGEPNAGAVAGAGRVAGENTPREGTAGVTLNVEDPILAGLPKPYERSETVASVMPAELPLQTAEALHRTPQTGAEVEETLKPPLEPKPSTAPPIPKEREIKDLAPQKEPATPEEKRRLFMLAVEKNKFGNVGALDKFEPQGTDERGALVRREETPSKTAPGGRVVHTVHEMDVVEYKIDNGLGLTEREQHLAAQNRALQIERDARAIADTHNIDIDKAREVVKQANEAKKVIAEENKKKNVKRSKGAVDKRDLSKKKEPLKQESPEEIAKKIIEKKKAVKVKEEPTETPKPVESEEATKLRAQLKEINSKIKDNGSKEDEALKAQARAIINKLADFAPLEGKNGGWAHHKTVEAILDNDAKGALDSIIKHGSTMESTVARAIKLVMGKGAPKVEFGLLENGNVGRYYQGTATFSHAHPVTNHTILHELGHAALNEALHNPHALNGKQKIAVAALKRLYKDLQGSKLLKNEYAFSGQFDAKPEQGFREFVMEAWTNPRFQKLLREAETRIDYANSGTLKRAWNKMVAMFRDLFNMPPLSKTLKALEDLMVPPEEMWESMTPDMLATVRRYGPDYAPKPRDDELARHLDQVHGEKFKIAPEKGVYEKARETYKEGGATGVIKKLFLGDGKYSMGDKAYFRIVDSLGSLKEEDRKAWNNHIYTEEMGIRPDFNLAQQQTIDHMVNASSLYGSIALDPRGQYWRVVDMPAKLSSVFKTLAKAMNRAGEGVGDRAFQLYAETRRNIGIVNSRKLAEAELAAAEAAGQEERVKALKKKIKGRAGFSYTPEEEASMKMIEAKYPEFKEALEEYREVMNQTIDTGIEAGIMDAETAAQWKEAIDYVPFKRIQEEADGARRKGMAFYGGLIPWRDAHSLEGSEKEVGSILQSMLNKHYTMITSAVANHTAKRQIEVVGVRGENGELRTYEGVVEGKLLVPIYENGKKLFYELPDQETMHAFQGAESISHPILDALNWSNRILRKTITTMPQFSVAQVFARDPFRSVFFSGVKHPSEILFNYIPTFLDICFRKDLESHPVVNRMRRLGIVGTINYMYEQPRGSPEHVAGMLGREQGSNWLHKLWSNAIRAGEHVALASDLTQRATIFEQTMREGGNEALAAYRAANIINFRNRGADVAMSASIRTIPFLGAFINGADIMYRTVAGHGLQNMPEKEARQRIFGTIAKGMTLAALYAMFVSGDEGFKKLDDNKKLTSLVIPGTDITVPIAQEVAVGMGIMLPVYLYNVMGDWDTKKAISVAMGGVSQGMSPPGFPWMMPQALSVAMQSYFNKSGQGYPIVGSGIENRDTADQYTMGTTEFAKLVGKTGMIAPAKVDHLMRGYFGTFYSAATLFTNGLIDSLNYGVHPAVHIQDMLTAFVIPEKDQSRKQAFYDHLKDAQKAHGSYSFELQTNPQRAQEYAKEHREILQQYPRLLALDRTMAGFRAQEKRIFDDRSITDPEVKRARIEAVERQVSKFLEQNGFK